MAGEKTDRADEFTGTRYANPFNSTPFTDCCGLAVLRPPPWLAGADVRCPGCKALVISWPVSGVYRG